MSPAFNLSMGSFSGTCCKYNIIVYISESAYTLVSMLFLLLYRSYICYGLLLFFLKFLFLILVKGLVLLYMEKVETSLDVKTSGYSNPKEEVFRCILTLHSLLENPPGDFPADLRGDIVKSFIGIFCHIR